MSCDENFHMLTPPYLTNCWASRSRPVDISSLIVMIDVSIPRPSNVRFQETFLVTGYSAAVITLPNTLLNENQALSSLQAFDLKNERNLCIVILDIQS